MESGTEEGWVCRFMSAANDMRQMWGWDATRWCEAVDLRRGRDRTRVQFECFICTSIGTGRKSKRANANRHGVWPCPSVKPHVGPAEAFAVNDPTIRQERHRGYTAEGTIALDRTPSFLNRESGDESAHIHLEVG